MKTKGYLIENIATIFIMDTLLCSVKDKELSEFMIDKHKIDKEEFERMKDAYLTWICERSANIDVMGNIKNKEETFTREQVILIIRKMITDEDLKYDYVREWLDEHLDEIKEEIIKHNIK